MFSITEKALAAALVAILIAGGIGYWILHSQIQSQKKVIDSDAAQLATASEEIQAQQQQTAIAQQDAQASSDALAAYRNQVESAAKIMQAKTQEDIQNASDHAATGLQIDSSAVATCSQPAVAAAFDGLRKWAGMHPATTGGNHGHKVAANPAAH